MSRRCGPRRLLALGSARSRACKSREAAPIVPQAANWRPWARPPWRDFSVAPLVLRRLTKERVAGILWILAAQMGVAKPLPLRHDAAVTDALPRHSPQTWTRQE